MAQNVPPIEWTDNALLLRKFVFEYWCATGHAPNYRNVHEATGLSRRDIIQAYKELQLGIVVVVDQDTQNCNLVKAPPFSSFPSQVELYIDDVFHSYIGCASEAEKSVVASISRDVGGLCRSHPPRRAVPSLIGPSRRVHCCNRMR